MAAVKQIRRRGGRAAQPCACHQYAICMQKRDMENQITCLKEPLGKERQAKQDGSDRVMDHFEHRVKHYPITK